MYYTVNDPGIFLHKVYERIMKSKMSASTGPYGRINKSFFLRNFKHNWTETRHEWSLNGTFKGGI
jgi:hypothetical protein